MRNANERGPDYCGPWSVQNPFRQMLVASQQSAAVVHFSCGLLHWLFGVSFAQTSSPVVGSG
jgi:hypothetical protein